MTYVYFGRALCSFFCVSLLFFLLALFSMSAVSVWFFGYGWHEQQRICQLVLLLVAAPLVLLVSQRALSRKVLFALGVVFVVGAWSSLRAAYPEWAAKEWARYLGMLLLVVLVGSVASVVVLQRAILWLMVVVGVIHAWKFVVCYMMAFVTGIYMLDPLLLISGFANQRFFGQFQILLLPVLAVLCVQLYSERRRWLAGFLFVVMVVQWCIAYSLAGRGLLGGLLVGHMVLLFVCPRLWRLVGVQAVAGLAGYVLLKILFWLIPLVFLDLNSVLRVDNLRTGLSGRDILWGKAWDMVLANPWLGVGPMHFAATYNPIAAHPHQVILQWLAEWGGAATMLALLIGCWGVLSGVRVLRSKQAEPVDAGLWMAIIGALVLAQVDGVFVMPYTETWLAVLVGLALARWGSPIAADRAQRLALGVFVLPVVLVLGRILFVEVPHVPRLQNDYLEMHPVGWAPRFWLQGWIPMGTE